MRQVLFGIGLSLFLGVFLNTAFAQNIELDPITITSEKSEFKLSQTPASVTIINQQKISDSKARSVPELLFKQEGLYGYDASGVGASGRVDMRGFYGGMSSHNLVLIDGIPQNSIEDKLVDWSLIPVNSIERIEIVRGPNSALYGDNALGGIIHIISKKPKLEPETSISNSIGEYRTQNYQISSSLQAERVGYNLNLKRFFSDGFRRYCDIRNFYTNLGLNFLPFLNQKINLNLGYNKKYRGAHPWALTESEIAIDRRQPRPGTRNDQGESKKQRVSLGHLLDINEDASLDTSFYLRNEDDDSFYTNTRLLTTQQVEGESSWGLMEKFSINPQVYNGRHQITLGFDLEQVDYVYREYSAPLNIRGMLTDDFSVKRTKRAPFIQDKINILDNLNLTLGLRYDEIEFTFDDKTLQTNSVQRDMEKYSPKAGLVFSPIEGLSLFGNYAKAFRIPTIGQMFSYGTYSNPDLDPEKGESCEFGFRVNTNQEVSFNASWYLIELEKEISYEPTLMQYVNIEKTKRQGVDSSLVFNLFPGLNTYFNYSFIKALDAFGLNRGKYLAHVPRHKGAVGLKFLTPIGVSLDVSVNRMGSSYLDALNTAKLAAYSLADLKLNYENKHFSCFGAINNLKDKEYNSYGYISGFLKYYTPAPSRTYTVGAEIKF